MVETLEQSDFTSAQRRIQSLVVDASEPSRTPSQTPDSFLAPLSIDEKKDALGPCASTTTKRCSDKGFLALSARDYLELLDATARIVRLDKSGATPSDLPPIFERLKLDVGNWKLLVSDFGRLFSSVAGAPKYVYEMRSLISKRRFYLKHPLQLAVTGP